MLCRPGDCCHATRFRLFDAALRPAHHPESRCRRHVEVLMFKPLVHFNRVVAMTAILLLGAVSAQAQTPKISAIVFAGASAMPLYVAQDKGFFAREGLSVDIVATPSSLAQMTG